MRVFHAGYFKRCIFKIQLRSIFTKSHNSFISRYNLINKYFASYQAYDSLINSGCFYYFSLGIQLSYRKITYIINEGRNKVFESLWRKFFRVDERKKKKKTNEVEHKNKCAMITVSFELFMIVLSLVWNWSSAYFSWCLNTCSQAEHYLAVFTPYINISHHMVWEYLIVSFQL